MELHGAIKKTQYARAKEASRNQSNLQGSDLVSLLECLGSVGISYDSISPNYPSVGIPYVGVSCNFGPQQPLFLAAVCRSVGDTLRRTTLRSDFTSVNTSQVNSLVDKILQCFVQTMHFGTDFAVLLRDEIEYTLKQTRTRFCDRLRPNARIQPQCQCHSQSFASVLCQRSGWWHDSHVARGGPRCAWFSATLLVEVTLAFKLGLKWSFERRATFI